jgi:hypothetical protein
MKYIVLLFLLATPPEPAALSASNDFAQQYNKWASYRRVVGTVSVDEIRAWHDTQKAWKHLNSTIQY